MDNLKELTSMATTIPVTRRCPVCGIDHTNACPVLWGVRTS